MTDERNKWIFRPVVFCGQLFIARVLIKSSTDFAGTSILHILLYYLAAVYYGE